MRQNDLHKRLFLLLIGQPTKNGNVFMGKGVGKLHPLFLFPPVFLRETHFMKPHCSVCSCLNHILQLLELYTYTDIFFGSTLLYCMYYKECGESNDCVTQVRFSDQEAAELNRSLQSTAGLKWTSDFKRFI